MNNWHDYVQSQLPPLPVAPGREQDIIAELAQQLDQAYHEALAAGAAEPDARRRAESQIPDWAVLARAIAAAEAPPTPPPLPPYRQGGSRLSDFIFDLRYALRGLRRSPGFALLAVLTLALGIGASTAMFSAVDAVLLRPLPFPQSQNLVTVLETSQRFPQMSVAWPNYLDWRDQNHVFTQLAAVRGSDMILAHLGPPSMVLGRRVTANYFSVLGVSPAIGRTFLPAEDGAGGPDVVVLSHAFFNQRLGADPRWLGRAIDLDGRSRTIVGVMPAGFPGLATPEDAPQFWTPLGAAAAQDPSFMDRGNHAAIMAVGRLRPGVSLDQARTDLSAIAGALARQYPKTNAGNTVAMASYQDLIVGDSGSALLLLLAAVGLLLLIACANVANLLLARAAAGQKTLAIRSALGATRARLVRQHLTESLCLGVLGGGVGLLLACLGLRAMPALGPAMLPGAQRLSMDARVVLFALGAALLTSLLCGLAPALAASDSRIAEALKDGRRVGGRRGHRLRHVLIAGQMALALLLLVGAGLLVRSLVQIERADPGFDPQGVLSFIIGLPATHYPTIPQQLEFFRQADLRLARVPGVAAVGGIYPLPLAANNRQEPFRIVGAPAPPAGREPSTDLAQIRGDYFGAMGMRLLRGRAFTEADHAQAPPVAIVDDSFAQRFFAGRALGRQIILDGQTRTIVGIVDHLGTFVRNASAVGTAGVETYIPQAQSKAITAALYFVVKAARGDPQSLRGAAIAQIQATDPDQPVTEVATMPQRFAALLAPSRRGLALVGVFALLALLLAAVGIYGVISYLVAERTHEIGVRMALGASRARVLALVIGEGLRLALAGAAVGVALALYLTRFLGAFLYGIAPADPLTLAAAPLLLLGIAALACYLPARRASRLDPLAALRRE